MDNNDFSSEVQRLYWLRVGRLEKECEEMAKTIVAEKKRLNNDYFLLGVLTLIGAFLIAIPVGIFVFAVGIIVIKRKSAEIKKLEKKYYETSRTYDRLVQAPRVAMFKLANVV